MMLDPGLPLHSQGVSTVFWNLWDMWRQMLQGEKDAHSETAH